MIADGRPFVDYYKILQVSPNCGARGLETAYRLLAKTYHPDHGGTADVDKFNDVVEAYKTLRNPEQRAQYDFLYTAKTGFIFHQSNGTDDEQAAYNDADAHSKVLVFLYKRRRENAQDAGVGRYFVQKMLNCSDENFEFHLWYLKAKGLIEITEQGMLAITIEGVDHVISISQAIMKEKLLLGRSLD